MAAELMIAVMAGEDSGSVIDIGKWLRVNQPPTASPPPNAAHPATHPPPTAPFGVPPARTQVAAEVSASVKTTKKRFGGFCRKSRSVESKPADTPRVSITADKSNPIHAASLTATPAPPPPIEQPGMHPVEWAVTHGMYRIPAIAQHAATHGELDLGRRKRRGSLTHSAVGPDQLNALSVTLGRTANVHGCLTIESERI